MRQDYSKLVPNEVYSIVNIEFRNRYVHCSSKLVPNEVVNIEFRNRYVHSSIKLVPNEVSSIVGVGFCAC